VVRCEARGFLFDVHCDVELQGTLKELFAALERRTGEASAVFSVSREQGPGTQWHVRMDGQILMGCWRLGEALHGLMVHITQRVIAARDDLLSIHAAAVATSDGALVLPGSSGSGKTTLCARLLQRGAAYLSDDSVALDPAGHLLGYPKALGFKAGTWHDFADAGLDDLDLERGQLVWQVPPARLASSTVTIAEPTVVVVPRFEAGASLQVEPLSRAGAARALLEQAQNLLAFGVVAALEVIGRLAARRAAHAVIYGNAGEAAAAVLELLRSADVAEAPFQVIPARSPAAGVTLAFPAVDVSAVCFEDGGLLVRGGTGEFATVDRVGALIWPLLDGQRTAESIAAELAPFYGAPSSEIESGLSAWIDDLVERGLLVRPSE
jgi:hypothetical protein